MHNERTALFALVVGGGALIVIVVGVVCFAAYKINAETFEFSSAVLRLVSFSIKISSRHEQANGGQRQSDHKA